MAKHVQGTLTLVGIFLLAIALAGFGVWRTDVYTAFAGGSYPTLEIDGELYYIVRSGNTLEELAEAFGVTPEELRAANELAEGEGLRTGQRLLIPDSSDVSARPAFAELMPTPVPETAVQQAAAPGLEMVEEGIYIVQRGDTLLLIERRTGVRVEDLVAYNDLQPLAPLYRGQRLRLLPGGSNAPANSPARQDVPGGEPVRYIIERGDTLQRIARLFGVTVDDIVAANSLNRADALYRGKVLLIPVGGSPAPAAPAPVEDADNGMSDNGMSDNGMLDEADEAENTEAENTEAENTEAENTEAGNTSNSEADNPAADNGDDAESNSEDSGAPAGAKGDDEALEENSDLPAKGEDPDMDDDMSDTGDIDEEADTENGMGESDMQDPDMQEPETKGEANGETDAADADMDDENADAVLDEEMLDEEVNDEEMLDEDMNGMLDEYMTDERALWQEPNGRIHVFSPAPGWAYHSQMEIIGLSQTFEGNVEMQLVSDDGEILAERYATGGSIDGYDFFRTYLRFHVQEPISATLVVFERSMEDGSMLEEIEIPLTLLPGQRFIDIYQPEVGAGLCETVLIAGYSNTFEANVSLEITDRAGEVVAMGYASGGAYGIYREFFHSFDYSSDEAAPILITAYELDASDRFGRIDPITVPVSYFPGDDPACE